MGAVSHERDCPLFWEPSPRSSRCCRRYSALAVPIPAILNFLPSLRWCGEGAAPPSVSCAESIRFFHTSCIYISSVCTPSPRSSRCCRRYSALAVPIPAILNFLPSLRWCGEGAAPPMGASASDNARKGQKSSLGRRKRGFSEKKWGKNLVESKNGCTFALAIQKWCLRQGRKAILKKRRRGVAQPGSAPVLGTGGRRFESCRPDSVFCGS